jgi:dienelactone hydrolase
VPLDAFGANGSVRRVADRLAAAAGLLALKMQLLQKRRLGLICPFWIRIWRSVAATRPSPPRRHHQDATTGLQPSIICGIIDPLIPADHGFMGEERNSFNPEASAQGWQRLIEG